MRAKKNHVIVTKEIPLPYTSRESERAMHPVFDTESTRFFASDNASGVHPAIIEALLAANRGHQVGYGDDPYTKAALKVFDELFERPVYTFFVYNGTGANGSSLAAMVRPHQSIICADGSHIFYDECGAPEHLTGAKLQPLPAAGGKLRPEQLEPLLGYLGNMHHAQPKVLAVSQATEFGTVYTLDELRALTGLAHAHGLFTHMDGARVANAAVSLGCTMADLTWKAGIDALSFGGTKNGLMFGEAVVFFDEALAKDFVYIRKNNGQLASKMRYIAAQYIALLSGGLWLRNATHANAMAALLAEGLSAMPGVRLVEKVEANEVFVELPRAAIEPLRKSCFFYVWDEANNIARFVTSWDTQAEEIKRFLAVCRKELETRR